MLGSIGIYSAFASSTGMPRLLVVPDFLLDDGTDKVPRVYEGQSSSMENPDRFFRPYLSFGTKFEVAD